MLAIKLKQITVIKDLRGNNKGTRIKKMPLKCEKALVHIKCWHYVKEQTL